MFALGLALLSGMSWGAADFVGGLMTRRLALLTVLVVSQGAGLVLTAGLVAILGDPVPPGDELLVGALGGLAGTVGLAALYHALAVGRMSIVAPTASLSVTVPVAIGLARGEEPSPLQLIGVAIAVGGIVLASRAPDPDDERRGGSAGIAAAFIAALFLGLLVTSLDVAGETSASWAVLLVRAVSVPLFLAAWLLRTDRRLPVGRPLGALLAVGVLDNAANLLFAVASQTGLLALVSVAGSLYPVSTVLLARAFLHERMSRWQGVGVTAAFAGVALIALGSAS
jgi:drug/metabolite transporter (DMT)-like permease